MEKGKYNILIFKLYYIIQGVKMYLSETKKDLRTLFSLSGKQNPQALLYM